MLKTKPVLPLAPQYIIDKAGKRTAVILDILTFEQLLEHVEDNYFGSIAKKAIKENEDEYISHQSVKKKITRKN